MSDENPGQPPLLPTLVDPALNAHLRRSLEALRDNCPDEDLRKRLEAVLAGTASLRDLSQSSAFESFVTPLTERGLKEFEKMEAEAGSLEELARSEPRPGGDGAKDDEASNDGAGTDGKEQGRSAGTW